MITNEDLRVTLAEYEEKLVSLESRVRTLKEDRFRDAIIFNASRHRLMPEEYLRRLGEHIEKEWS
ncbi:MAG: hypothetical protein QXV32_02245 [Conexivisphaerales archaeon]